MGSGRESAEAVLAALVADAHRALPAVPFWMDPALSPAFSTSLIPLEGSAVIQVATPRDSLEIELVFPLRQRLAALMAADMDAEWIAVAAELLDGLPLAASSFERGLFPELTAALQDDSAGTTVEQSECRRQVAGNLLSAMAIAEKVVSWAQTVQTQALAALARPGVVAPMADLLALTTRGGRVAPDGSDPVESLSDKDFDAVSFGAVSVSGSPEWDPVIREESSRLASAEVGVVLAIPAATAASRLAEAVELIDRHPLVVQSWRHGRIDRQRVRAFASRTVGLSDAVVGEIEEEFLADGGERVGSTTCVTLHRRLERVISRRDPEACGRRRTLARADRRVFVQPLDDGMSRFCADLPAPVALLAQEVMDSVASGLPESARAGRPRGQTRADVFSDIITRLAAFGQVDLRGGASESANAPEFGPHHGAEVADLLPIPWEALGASVSVVVDAQLFTRCASDDPGVLECALLERYGDLPLDLARALAVSARRARIVLTGTSVGDARDVQCPGDSRWRCSPAQDAAASDGSAASTVADSLSSYASADGGVPIAGAPPRSTDDGRGTAAQRTVGIAGRHDDHALGHWTYRPDRETAERVIHRDRVCRFPGCRRPARQCDLDHRVPFDEGGPTSSENLDVLCRYHHRIKTHAGWRAVRLPGNRLRWTSPLGTIGVDEPETDADRLPGSSLRESGGRSDGADEPPSF